MFLGLQDPDPDLLVRGMDPDPASDPSYYFVTVYDFLSLKNDIKRTFKN
jgi:hypothetical protein